MVETKPAEISRPTNVIAALALITGEIGGIEKLTAAERNRRGMGGGEGGISYAFRGIDQITATAQPLFAKYGVVIVPDVQEERLIDIVVNSKPWTDAVVTVCWHIYGPGGVEDVISATTVGMGRDGTDKGFPKAITQAYKNLILRLFSIGDPDDDTDGRTVEADSGGRSTVRAAAPRSDEPREVTKAQEVAAAFSTLDADQKKLVSAHAKNELGVNNVMRSGEHAEALLAYIQLLDGATVEAEPEEEAF